jgi:hypothetical protein
MVPLLATLYPNQADRLPVGAEAVALEDLGLARAIKQGKRA